MPKSTTRELQQYYAKDRTTWRDWLEKNHAISPGVWLVYYKKQTGKPSVSDDEAIEEALCFGWVDSRPNVLDDERFMKLFSPRKPQSPWSKLNKQRVEKLLAEGLMAPAGLAKIEAAKRDGSWDSYDAVESLTIPIDLQQALAANTTAQNNFAAFPPSSKKNILWWIASAKQPETRRKRVEETVALAAQNIKANHYRQ